MENKICELCEVAKVKYSCPKCNILYCSLRCYQSEKHRECSEDFYKENVLQGLAEEGTPLSKDNILKILERAHQSNPTIGNELELDSDDDDEVYSEIQENVSPPEPNETPEVDNSISTHFNLFKSIDDIGTQNSSDVTSYRERKYSLDSSLSDIVGSSDSDDLPDDYWDKLTSEEKQGFIKFLKNENLEDLIPTWIPWWMHYTNEIKQELNAWIESFKVKCPLHVNLDSYSSFCVKEPPACVKYNLVNILAGYSFVTRYLNGEYQRFPKEFATFIGTISLGLECHQNYTDYEEAVKSVEDLVRKTNWIYTNVGNIGKIRSDLENIFRGPSKTEPKFYVLSALSDLITILNEAIKKDKYDDPFPKTFPVAHFTELKIQPKHKIKLYVKRIEYFLSYVQHFFKM